MSALRANLAITAVSQTHARFRLYTSGQFVSATSKDLPPLKAILASAAAPTYFPPRVYDKETLVDGGIVANAPEIAGIGLVKRVLGTPLERIRVLSIGTASPAAGNLPMASAPYSIVDWMLPRRNLLLLTLDTQEHPRAASPNSCSAPATVASTPRRMARRPASWARWIRLGRKRARCFARWPIRHGKTTRTPRWRCSQGEPGAGDDRGHLPAGVHGAASKADRRGPWRAPWNACSSTYHPR